MNESYVTDRQSEISLKRW